MVTVVIRSTRDFEIALFFHFLNVFFEFFKMKLFCMDKQCCVEFMMLEFSFYTGMVPVQFYLIFPIQLSDIWSYMFAIHSLINKICFVISSNCMDKQ